MTTFGLSAFLKLISLPPKPQLTELRKRLRPAEKKGGYDYHRTMKVYAKRLLLENLALSDTIAAAEQITKKSERLSAIEALKKTDSWKHANPKKFLLPPSALFESPTGNFKVNFTPDFGFEFGSESVGVYIWNTKSPELDERLCIGALSLFPSIYKNIDGAPVDLAVLSLRSPRSPKLLSLSEFPEHAVTGEYIVRHVDRLIDLINEEVGRSRPIKRDVPLPAPTL